MKIARRLRPLACFELLFPDLDLNRVALVLFLKFLLSPFESGSASILIETKGFSEHSKHITPVSVVFQNWDSVFSQMWHLFSTFNGIFFQD